QTSEGRLMVYPLNIFSFTVGNTGPFERAHLKPNDRFTKPPALPLKPIFGGGQIGIDPTAPTRFFQHLSEGGLGGSFSRVQSTLRK
ncbi:MAG TPA: hypothetical protein VMB70_15385, partial [Terriglobia bacterium]|nr:hypothetical protein [Terriglobia bacterium]